MRRWGFALLGLVLAGSPAHAQRQFDRVVPPSGVVQITLSAMPNLTQGTASTTQIVTGSGGTGPYTCALQSGSLPTSITESTECTYTGTPSASGTFVFTIRLTDNVGGVGHFADKVYTVIVAASASLPAGWVCSPIGTPGLAGSGAESSGAWTITGSDSEFGTADKFFYCYQVVSGAKQITALVNPALCTTTYAYAQNCGLEIRQSTAVGSVYANIAHTNSDFIDTQCRTATNALTTSWRVTMAAQTHFRVRTNAAGAISTAYGSDGTAWSATSCASDTPAIVTGSYLIGMRVSAYFADQLSTGHFSAVVVEDTPADLTTDTGMYRSSMLGFGTQTKGGFGSAAPTIYRIASLAASGSGSLREAMEATGCRVVVFETSGRIDLGFGAIQVTDGCLTVAGQTAPAPGIQIIQGSINLYTVSDVVLQHFRIYHGETPSHIVQIPLFVQCGSHDIVIDHMTVMWGDSSNISLSPGTNALGVQCGNTVPYNIAVLDSNMSEMLGNGYPPYQGGGAHGAGTIVYAGDNCSFTLARNVWAHNTNRQPWVGVGCRGVILNNVSFNASSDPNATGDADTYNNGFLQLIGVSEANYGDITGATEIAVVGNRFVAGPRTVSGTKPYKVGFTSAQTSGVRVWLEDNADGSRFIAGSSLNQQWAAMGAMSAFTSNAAIATTGRIEAPENWYTNIGFTPIASGNIEAYVAAHAGARPTNRDAIETGVFSNLSGRTGTYKYVNASVAALNGGATYAFIAYAANTSTFTLANPNDAGTCGSFWDATPRSKLFCRLETDARGVEP